MNDSSVGPRALFVSLVLDWAILAGAIIVLLFWLTGVGLFYSETSPVMSPFTAFSLLLMALTRIASKSLETWSKPMTLAILGIVASGNFSSLYIQMFIPELFLETVPALVPTSAMTSVGLMLFCFYEILITLRRTPDSAFIMDDVILHLALFPGAVSLLGHVLNVTVYRSPGLDARVGIGYLEMVFMGAFAVTATIANRDLFLWRFLARSNLNRITFGLLFLNQYIAPIVVGLLVRDGAAAQKIGIELFVMVAGVLATLLFLVFNAVGKRGLR